MRPLATALGLLLFAPAFSSAAEEIKKVTPRKQVAVKDFDDKSNGNHGWHNVGSGMAEMLTTALVKTGKFAVLERKQLAGVAEEQALAGSGAAAKGTNAQTGKIVVAGLQIYGAVTECGMQERSYAMVKRQTSRVACDVRLVDTTTGEVVKSFQSAGEESATGVNTAVGQFGAAGFDSTVIGKATRKVIDDIVDQVSAASEAVAWSGKISQLVGTKIFINSGSNDNQTVGAVYDVYKMGQEITDPDSGQSLGFETTKVGAVKVVKVDQKYSVCEGVEGSGFERGQIVKQKADK